jgi:hypothetical protein
MAFWVAISHPCTLRKKFIQLFKNPNGLLSGHIYMQPLGVQGYFKPEKPLDVLATQSEKPLKDPCGLQICARSTIWRTLFSKSGGQAKKKYGTRHLEHQLFDDHVYC